MQNSFKKFVTTTLKLTITLGIVFFLVRKLGWSTIYKTVSEADFHWLLIAIVVFILSGVLGVFQWKILLKNRKIPLSFNRAFRLYFVGLFFNNFVFGGFLGDAVKIAEIRSKDGKGLQGLAATFLDRFAGLWAMCGFAVLGSIILLNKGVTTNGKIDTAMIALVVTFVLFAGIVVFLISKPIQKIFFSFIDRFPILQKARIHEVVSEMLIEAHDISVLVWVILLSTFIQLLRIGVHILTALSLGLLTGANFQYFFIFVPIIAMLMTLPLPFGVREAAGGALFSMAGFPTDAAFVMGFLASLVGLMSSLLGGVFFITNKTHLRKKHETLYRSPTSE